MRQGLQQLLMVTTVLLAHMRILVKQSLELTVNMVKAAAVFPQPIHHPYEQTDQGQNQTAKCDKGR